MFHFPSVRKLLKQAAFVLVPREELKATVQENERESELSNSISIDPSECGITANLLCHLHSCIIMLAEVNIMCFGISWPAVQLRGFKSLKAALSHRFQRIFCPIALCCCLFRLICLDF